MLYFRLLTVVCIVFSSMFVGRVYTSQLKKTAEFARIISDDLKTIASYIGFTHPELFEILKKISMCSDEAEFWNMIAEQLNSVGVEKSVLLAVEDIGKRINISADTKRLLVSLSSCLGQTDAENQKQMISLCSERMYDEYNTLISKYDEKNSLYTKLSLLIGLLISVVLF